MDTNTGALRTGSSSSSAPAGPGPGPETQRKIRVDLHTHILPSPEVFPDFREKYGLAW